MKLESGIVFLLGVVCILIGMMIDYRMMPRSVKGEALVELDRNIDEVCPDAFPTRLNLKGNFYIFTCPDGRTVSFRRSGDND